MLNALEFYSLLMFLANNLDLDQECQSSGSKPFDTLKSVPRKNFLKKIILKKFRG